MTSYPGAAEGKEKWGSNTHPWRARHRLRQNRCVFSARRNCPRSRWRTLSGRLFRSSIVLRFMDSQSAFAI